MVSSCRPEQVCQDVRYHAKHHSAKNNKPGLCLFEPAKRPAHTEKGRLNANSRVIPCLARPTLESSPMTAGDVMHRVAEAADPHARVWRFIVADESRDQGALDAMEKMQISSGCRPQSIVGGTHAHSGRFAVGSSNICVACRAARSGQTEISPTHMTEDYVIAFDNCCF